MRKRDRGGAVRVDLHEHVFFHPQSHKQDALLKSRGVDGHTSDGRHEAFHLHNMLLKYQSQQISISRYSTVRRGR